MADALLRILMSSALLATGAAVLALLLGAAGVPLLVLPHAVVLIASGAVAFIGFFILQLTAQHRFGTKQFDRLLKQHSPRWMRWLCDGIGIAAFCLWIFLLVYRRYEPPGGGVSSLVAGTFCLLVAPATFLTFYAYRRLRPQLQRHCSRGHDLPVGAAYCPECGEHVRPVG
jgi:hypothetical protein